MELDQNGLEILSPAECMALLGLGTLGRVGFTSHALPAVLPVHYRLQDDAILVRTSFNSVLDTGLRNTIVAFEVDDGSQVHAATWSIHVVGRTRQAPDHTPAPPLTMWSGPTYQITPAQISGRRLLD